MADSTVKYLNKLTWLRAETKKNVLALPKWLKMDGQYQKRSGGKSKFHIKT